MVLKVRGQPGHVPRQEDAVEEAEEAHAVLLRKLSTQLGKLFLFRQVAALLKSTKYQSVVFPEYGPHLVVLLGLDEEELFRDAVDAVVRGGLEAVLVAGDAEDGVLALRHLQQDLGQAADQHLHLGLLARLQQVRPGREG